MLHIIVRDSAPVAIPGLFTPMGNGAVRMEMSDAQNYRHQEIADFMRANPSVIRGGGGGRDFGKGSAKDATEAESFAIGQLTYLEAKAFAKWYQPLKYETILGAAIDTSAGPWAKSVDYIVTDGVGQGEFISPAANDVPMVDVAMAKVTIGVGLAAIGYDYTMEDIRTSAYLGRPLSESKQSQAILAYKRHASKVALLGSTPKNWTGLYNNASATAANRTSGSVWDAATGDTIINDILVAYAAFMAGTQGNVAPTKLIVPLSTRTVLRKPRASGDPMTIQRYIETELGMQIEDDVALETAGSGPSKRVVFAAPDNENMVFHVPKGIEFMAPQINGFRVVVIGDYKLGGFELRRIQTVRYMDGV